MKNLCLSLSRFAICAWIGAACLFVVITTQDVQSTDFDSATKASIVVRRFPVYYSFGFPLEIAALVLGMVGLSAHGRKQCWAATLLMGLVLLLSTVDYFWIYKPLEAMTADVSASRPATFVDYHQASKYINFAQLSVAFFAALALCWPVTCCQPTPTTCSADT